MFTVPFQTITEFIQCHTRALEPSVTKLPLGMAGVTRPSVGSELETQGRLGCVMFGYFVPAVLRPGYPVVQATDSDVCLAGWFVG